MEYARLKLMAPGFSHTPKLVKRERMQVQLYNFNIGNTTYSTTKGNRKWINLKIQNFRVDHPLKEISETINDVKYKSKKGIKDNETTITSSIIHN